MFKLSLPEDGDLRVAVYDLTGRELNRLHEGAMPAGSYSLHWDGRTQLGETAGTGVYLIRVEYVGSSGKRETAVQRVVMVK